MFNQKGVIWKQKKGICLLFLKQRGPFSFKKGHFLSGKGNSEAAKRALSRPKEATVFCFRPQKGIFIQKKDILKSPVSATKKTFFKENFFFQERRFGSGEKALSRLKNTFFS